MFILQNWSSSKQFSLTNIFTEEQMLSWHFPAFRAKPEGKQQIRKKENTKIENSHPSLLLLLSMNSDVVDVLLRHMQRERALIFVKVFENLFHSFYLFSFFTLRQNVQNLGLCLLIDFFTPLPMIVISQFLKLSVLWCIPPEQPWSLQLPLPAWQLRTCLPRLGSLSGVLSPVVLSSTQRQHPRRSVDRIRLPPVSKHFVKNLSLCVLFHFCNKVWNS